MPPRGGECGRCSRRFLRFPTIGTVFIFPAVGECFGRFLRFSAARTFLRFRGPALSFIRAATPLPAFRISPGGGCLAFEGTHTLPASAACIHRMVLILLAADQPASRRYHASFSASVGVAGRHPARKYIPTDLRHFATASEVVCFQFGRSPVCQSGKSLRHSRPCRFCLAPYTAVWRHGIWKRTVPKRTVLSFVQVFHVRGRRIRKSAG